MTALQQRVRAAHPTFGGYEAADLQWWWRSPRASDEHGQLLWFDDAGRPEAAAVLVTWGAATSLVPILLPDATPARYQTVVDAGLGHAAAAGVERVDLKVGESDEILRGVLAARGFVAVEAMDDPAVVSIEAVEAWLEIDARPAVGPAPDGYRLLDRRATAGRPHHMVGRSQADVEERLGATSLYRPDLDLVVLDATDEVAAYGLFWFDPATRTGLVEPMRTEDAHQRRGLARLVLTSGVDRLARAGATRVKICWVEENPGASRLYRSVGFVPVRQTIVMAGPTAR